MRTLSLFKTPLSIVILLLTSILAGPFTAQAQGGLSASVTYDFLPYQEFDEPIRLDDGSTIDDARVRLTRYRATLTYPVIFSEGRTVLVNDFSYQLIDFEYKNWDYPLERLHSASYTLLLQRQLSQKWSMWALGTPSLASDLKDDISENDFSFQAASVFIRHFSERFSVGIGAAYSTQFGGAGVLPLLTLDWTNGKNLMMKAILPASLEFWYSPGPGFDLGILLSGDGNNYRGDPNIYGVENPELRYTMLTIGPTVRVSIAKGLRIYGEGGLLGLHRFEFYDSDTEIGSFDLKPSQYVRVGLQYGG